MVALSTWHFCVPGNTDRGSQTAEGDQPEMSLGEIPAGVTACVATCMDCAASAAACFCAMIFSQGSSPTGTAPSAAAAPE